MTIIRRMRRMERVVQGVVRGCDEGFMQSPLVHDFPGALVVRLRTAAVCE